MSTRPARSPREATMDFLLSGNLVLVAAGELNVAVSPEQAWAALQSARQRAQYDLIVPDSREAALLRLTSDTHLTLRDRLWVVQTFLSAGALGTALWHQAERSITPAQALAYYLDHLGSFATPESRTVAVIQSFHRSNAERAQRELLSGVPLARVIATRNQEVRVGGTKHRLTSNAIAHSYEAAFFHAKPNVPVGPLKAEMYFVFEVTRIYPAHVLSFEEAYRAIARRLVSREDHRLLLDRRRSVFTKLAAKIACVRATLAQLCTGPIEKGSLADDPNAATTITTGPPPRTR